MMADILGLEEYSPYASAVGRLRGCTWDRVHHRVLIEAIVLSVRLPWGLAVCPAGTGH